MDNGIHLLFTGLAAEADVFVFGTSTVALVRADDRLILFDTGPYAYRPILQGRLRGLGIEGANVDTLVLSHLHWDSASNADLFPKAEIIVHARELAAAEAGVVDTARPGYMARALRKLRLRPIEREMELTSHIRTIDLPGHTAGLIGLQVGRDVLAGDAVVCAKDAVAGEAGGISHDAAGAASSLAKVLAMADIVYPGHDRPFRVGPRLSYVSDYELRIRLFVDPAGEDQELQISAKAAKSFATWPE